MNKPQQNRLAMQEVVAKLFTDNVPLWENNTPIVVAVDRLKSINKEIQTYSTQQVKSATPGITADKNLHREAFIEELIELIANIRPYALSVDNNELLYSVDYSLSELRRLKDEELRAVAEVIAGRATEFETELADYNLTPAMLASIKKGTEALVPEKAEARQTGNEGKLATEKLPELFAAAKKQLRILKDLVPSQLKNPEFTTLYEMARKVRKTKGGRGPNNNDTHDTPGDDAPDKA